jgi:hypothetical protein
MSIFPKLFFALVGCDFAQLAFSSAGHFRVSLVKIYPFPRIPPGQAGKFIQSKAAAGKGQGARRLVSGQQRLPAEYTPRRKSGTRPALSN